MIAWLVGRVAAKYLAMAALIAVPLLLVSLWGNLAQWSDARNAAELAEKDCQNTILQSQLDALAAAEAEGAEVQADIDAAADLEQDAARESLESIVTRTEHAAAQIRQATRHESQALAAAGQCDRIPAGLMRPLNAALSTPRGP